MLQDMANYIKKLTEENDKLKEENEELKNNITELERKIERVKRQALWMLRGYREEYELKNKIEELIKEEDNLL